jgi:hypothetical protein
MPRPHFPNLTICDEVGWPNTFGINNDLRLNTCGSSVSYYNPGIAQKRYWGWGSGAADTDPNRTTLLPKDKEIMSIMPGYRKWNTGEGVLVNRNIIINGRNTPGGYYMNQWEQVIEAMPKTVLICSWNDWAEEPAIESCVGANGWKDFYGNSCPDYYLQITELYVNVFKKDSLKAGTYFQTVGNSAISYYDGNTSKLYDIITTIPARHPVILLPNGWPAQKGYSRRISKEAFNNTGNGKISFSAVAYPNPFNPTTKINYTLPEKGLVQLEIFNVVGEKIVTLINDVKEMGPHEVSFNGSNYPSGAYIYRLKFVASETGEKFEKSDKILLIK